MKIDKKVLALAMIGFYSLLISINIYIIPPNYDLIKAEMRLNDFDVSLINGLFYLLIGFSAFGWAYITDKYRLGRKKILIVATLLASVTNYLTSFSNDFYSLVFLYGLTGVLLGSSYSIIFSILADNFHVKERLVALALWNLSQGIGASAGFLFSFLVGEAFGWRQSFLIGSIALLLSILPLLRIIEPKRGESEEYLKEIFKRGMEYNYRLTLTGLKKTLSKKTNMFLLLEYFAISVGWGAYSQWGLHYLKNVTNLSKLGAGLILGLIGVGGAFHVVVAQLLQRFQSGKLSMKLLFASFFALIEGTSYIVLFTMIPYVKLWASSQAVVDQAFAILNALKNNTMFLFIVLFASLGNMVGTTTKPINTTTISEVNLPEERASFLGYMLIFELFGKFAGALVTGTISTIYGSLYLGILSSLLFYYLGSIFWLMVRKNYERDRKQLENELKLRALEILED